METFIQEKLLEILNSAAVGKALRLEMLRKNKIEHTRLWRMATILPGEDDIRQICYPSKAALIGVPEKSKYDNLSNISFDVMTLKEGYDDLVGDISEIVQEEFWEKRILRTVYDGWICQNKIRTRAGFGRWIKLPEGIEVESIEAYGSYLVLPEFLRQIGFPPLIEDSAIPNFFTMEVSGIAVLHRNEKVQFIREPHFVRRSLVDDEGNLIYLGLDEGTQKPTQNPENVALNESCFPFPVNLFPWMGYKLVKYSQKSLRYAKFVDYTPLFRYSYLPIITETHLPLIDIPVIDKNWVDVFLLSEEKALVYLPLPEANFDQLISEIYTLWNTEIEKKDYKLLKFTKDIDHVEAFLRLKMRILRQYYEVIELSLSTTHGDNS